MTRPIIIAICGKSATGKTSLAHQLEREFKKMGVTVHRIISDTTRPPREGEKDGVDYYFISELEFDRRCASYAYLEKTSFRGWHYGTNYHSLTLGKDSINIGIFNAKGVFSLIKYCRKFIIVPVYLEDPLSVRLRRSYQREGKWRLEYLRRAFVDWRDFKNIKSTLNHFKCGLLLTEQESTRKRAKTVMQWLEYMRAKNYNCELLINI